MKRISEHRKGPLPPFISVSSFIFRAVDITGVFFSCQARKLLKPSIPGEPVPASPPMSVQSGRLHQGAPPGPGEPWSCGDQSPFGECTFSLPFLQQTRSALGGSVCSLKNAGVANRTWQESSLSPASSGLLMLSGLQQELKLDYRCGKTLLFETSGPEEVSKQSLINISFLQLTLSSLPCHHQITAFSLGLPRCAHLGPPLFPLGGRSWQLFCTTALLPQRFLVSCVMVAGSFGPTFRLCFLLPGLI